MLVVSTNERLIGHARRCADSASVAIVRSAQEFFDLRKDDLIVVDCGSVKDDALREAIAQYYERTVCTRVLFVLPTNAPAEIDTLLAFFRRIKDLRFSHLNANEFDRPACWELKTKELASPLGALRADMRESFKQALYRMERAAAFDAMPSKNVVLTVMDSAPHASSVKELALQGVFEENHPLRRAPETVAAAQQRFKRLWQKWSDIRVPAKDMLLLMRLSWYRHLIHAGYTRASALAFLSVPTVEAFSLAAGMRFGFTIPQIEAWAYHEFMEWVASYIVPGNGSDPPSRKRRTKQSRSQNNTQPGQSTGLSASSVPNWGCRRTKFGV